MLSRREVAALFWTAVLFMALALIVSKIRAAAAAVGSAIVEHVGAVFWAAVPYMRSRTNWLQTIQFVGVALGVPLTAQQSDEWSLRLWLIASAVIWILGIFCRGPKYRPEPQASAPSPDPGPDESPRPFQPLAGETGLRRGSFPVRQYRESPRTARA